VQSNREVNDVKTGFNFINILFKPKTQNVKVREKNQSVFKTNWPAGYWVSSLVSNSSYQFTFVVQSFIILQQAWAGLTNSISGMS
jgi:hypothetical protein